MDWNALFDITVIEDFLQYYGLVYLGLSFALFFIGKLCYDFFTPFSLDKELTTKDNKAVAISFTGYLAGLGLIIWSVVGDEISTGDFVSDILDVLIWSLIGIVLLQISRIINDKILLYRFNNTKELIEDKNPGTGLVELGTCIGSALIITSVITGEDTGFVNGIISTLIFFVTGQVLFVLYGIIFQKATSFDLHEEIEKDNAAAGLSYGLSLIAISIIIADYIKTYDSLVVLVIWFIAGTAVLMLSRLIVDKLILPSHSLDDEIKQDRNWGAALIEGIVAISTALIISAAY